MMPWLFLVEADKGNLQMKKEYDKSNKKFQSLLRKQEQLLRGKMNRRYHQISNISGTKSPNLNVSCLVLQMSLPNPLKPGVKWRMKM